jgi:hypothetical protein
MFCFIIIFLVTASRRLNQILRRRIGSRCDLNHVHRSNNNRVINKIHNFFFLILFYVRFVVTGDPVCLCV